MIVSMGPGIGLAADLQTRLSGQQSSSPSPTVTLIDVSSPSPRITLLHLVTQAT